jgi:hypothetical protein
MGADWMLEQGLPDAGPDGSVEPARLWDDHLGGEKV